MFRSPTSPFAFFSQFWRIWRLTDLKINFLAVFLLRMHLFWALYDQKSTKKCLSNKICQIFRPPHQARFNQNQGPVPGEAE